MTYSTAKDSFQFLYLEIKGAIDYLIAAISGVGGDVCAAWGMGEVLRPSARHWSSVKQIRGSKEDKFYKRENWKHTN